MSHSATSEKVDPNLTPMLDMVLQLVMFFMICPANFVQDDLNESIVLPKSVTGKSLDTSNSDLIFININEAGHLLPNDGDRQPLLTPQQIEFYMRRRYEFGEKAAKGSGAKTIVIIRAHEQAQFDAIYRAVAACKRAGYQKLQFRVLMAD